MVDEKGALLDIPTIPDRDFDFKQVITGREAYLLTVPRYRIAMNGFVSKRMIWQKAWDEYDKPGYRGIHEDENIGKLMLIYSDKVSFVEAEHYYTINSESVTHVFNDKVFDWLTANLDMLNFVEKIYGPGTEYHETELADYYAYVHATELLANSLESLDDTSIDRYFCEMKKWHNRIKWSAVKGYDGTTKWLIGKNYTLRWLWKLKQHNLMKYYTHILKTQRA